MESTAGIKLCSYLTITVSIKGENAVSKVKYVLWNHFHNSRDLLYLNFLFRGLSHSIVNVVQMLAKYATVKCNLQLQLEIERFYHCA